MAHAIVLLYKELGATGKCIHAAHFLMKKQAAVANGGDYAKLVHFGLLEQKPRTQRGEDVTGYFRLTDKAIAFVENRERVEKYIYLYDGKFLSGYDADETVLNVHFSDQVMKEGMVRHAAMPHVLNLPRRNYRIVSPVRRQHL